MMELLTKALWFTLIAYILFILGRWFYKKFLKDSPDQYFYFLSLKNENGEWYLRIESPSDEFDLKIEVSCNSEILYTKNALLKEGINRIKLSNDKISNVCFLKMSSLSQVIERKFEEAEI